jgi:hypothetical protein
MGRREELLRVEAERWAAFEAALDAVPADQLDAPGLNAEGWAVRDMMWHQVNGMNDREFERSRSMRPDEVRADLHRARSTMLERFGVLDEITADADEWFEESGPLHYAEHLRELRAWAPSRDA